MAKWPKYEKAVRCTGSIPPGAQSLMNWVLQDFKQGAYNLGIYNCRTVRGRSTKSLHSEGRAIDVGFSGVANPAGTRLLNKLLPHVGTLGIQQIIWNRRIYSSRYPNGARYTGDNPHTDHLHIELTRQAANLLNIGFIRKTLNQTNNIDWVAVRRYYASVVLAKFEKLKTPVTGKSLASDVKTLQEALNIIHRADIAVDGKYGPSTFLHVAGFQNNVKKLGYTISDPAGTVGDATKWWMANTLRQIKDGRM